MRILGKYIPYLVSCVSGGLALGVLTFIISMLIEVRHRDALLNELSAVISNQVSSILSDVQSGLAAFHVQGVGPCDDSALEPMRKLLVSQFYVKDILITRNDTGVTECQATGIDLHINPVVDDTGEVVDDDWTWQAVRVNYAQLDGLLLKRYLSPTHHISALIPSNALLPPLATQPALSGGAVFLLTRNEVVVGRWPENATDIYGRGLGQDHHFIQAHIPGSQLTLHLYVSTVTLHHISDLRKSRFVLPAILAGGLLGLLVPLAQRTRPSTLSELEVAIEKGQLFAHYQPILELATGRVAGCEALIRWRREDGTMISPAAFIMEAERNGLALPMTNMLMRRVLMDLESLFARYGHLQVSINLFRDHFDRPETAREIEALFERSGIRLEQLVFEITERLPIRDPEMASHVVADLRDLGCSVALDDVGTGHNGLKYMMELGVDTIKVDKLFIDGLLQTGFSKTIVQALFDMANDLKMKVVAEGLEQTEQLAVLREVGIKYAQGFLFSKPLPPDVFVEMVELALNEDSHQHIQTTAA